MRNSLILSTYLLFAASSLNAAPLVRPSTTAAAERAAIATESAAARTTTTTTPAETNPSILTRIFPSSNKKHGWEFCNKSSNPSIWVTIVAYTENSWATSGWYKLAKNECSVILKNIGSKTVYYYAHSENSTWGGKNNFCVDPNNKFSISSNIKSCAYPFALKGFKEISDDGSGYILTTLVD